MNAKPGFWPVRRGLRTRSRPSGRESFSGENERFYRLLFEQNDAAMLLISPRSGEIVEANRAAAAFCGFAPRRLQRMNIGQVNALIARQLKMCRGRVRGVHFIVPQRQANGAVRTAEVFGSPLDLPQRKLVFAIIHDITQRRVLETAMLENSERERQSVGQDLHHLAGGGLAGAALIAKALAARLAAKTSPDAALAGEVVQHINDSIRNIGSLAHRVRSCDPGATGLNGALELLASQFCCLPDVRSQLVAPHSLPALDPFVAMHLFRIATEAATRALQHGAHYILFRLLSGGGQFRLTIRDNGARCAHNPDLSRGCRVGLRSMTCRAKAIGGQLLIRRNRGPGMTILCSVPLSANGGSK